MSQAPPTFEPFVGQRFIYARLIQSLGLVALQGQRVHKDVAPPGTPFPYTLMTVVNAEDLVYIGGVRVWTNILWQVEFWARTNDDGVIAEGAAHIDAALHGSKGPMLGSTYGSGYISSTTRERALALPAQVDGDVIIRRGGGEYRQIIEPIRT